MYCYEKIQIILPCVYRQRVIEMQMTTTDDREKFSVACKSRLETVCWSRSHESWDHRCSKWQISDRPAGSLIWLDHLPEAIRSLRWAESLAPQCKYTRNDGSNGIYILVTSTVPCKCLVEFSIMISYWQVITLYLCNVLRILWIFGYLFRDVNCLSFFFTCKLCEVSLISRMVS